VANSLTCSAQPAGAPFAATRRTARFEAIGKLIAEWAARRAGCGCVPFHPDGAAHENTERVSPLRHAQTGPAASRLPVHRGRRAFTSTTEARGARCGARSIDAASAAIILDQFLRQPPMSTFASRRPKRSTADPPWPACAG